jgi:hypothetical protein
LPTDDVPKPPTAFLSFAERDEIVVDTRKVQMTASRRRFRAIELPVLAGKRLIRVPIPDIQHENPRGVG